MGDFLAKKGTNSVGPTPTRTLAVQERKRMLDGEIKVLPQSDSVHRDNAANRARETVTKKRRGK